MNSGNEFLKIYIADVKPLCNEALFNCVYEDMPDYRKRKVDRVKMPASKRESLGAGLLFKYALSDINQECLLDNIKEGKNGKPEFDTDASVFFNLSHSNEMVMCVLSSKPVGCDIQSTARGDVKIAKRCFSDEEKNYIYENPADEKQMRDRFFRIWAMKEAYTKLSGEGIQKEFRTFNVLDCDGFFVEGDIIADKEVDSIAEMEKCEMASDYKMAVCSRYEFENIPFEKVDIYSKYKDEK